MLWRSSTQLARMRPEVQQEGREGKREREGGGWRLFPGRKTGSVGVWEEGQTTQHPVLTCSVFVVVAEVETNCSAELQHIAPLVFVYHFIF